MSTEYPEGRALRTAELGKGCVESGEISLNQLTAPIALYVVTQRTFTAIAVFSGLPLSSRSLPVIRPVHGVRVEHLLPVIRPAFSCCTAVKA